MVSGDLVVVGWSSPQRARSENYGIPFSRNDDVKMDDSGVVENDAELFSAAEVEQESCGVESPVLAG